MEQSKKSGHCRENVPFYANVGVLINSKRIRTWAISGRCNAWKCACAAAGPWSGRRVARTKNHISWLERGVNNWRYEGEITSQDLRPRPRWRTESKATPTSHDDPQRRPWHSKVERRIATCQPSTTKTTAKSRRSPSRIRNPAKAVDLIWMKWLWMGSDLNTLQLCLSAEDDRMKRWAAKSRQPTRHRAGASIAIGAFSAGFSDWTRRWIQLSSKDFR